MGPGQQIKPCRCRPSGDSSLVGGRYRISRGWATLAAQRLLHVSGVLWDRFQFAFGARTGRRWDLMSTSCRPTWPSTGPGAAVVFQKLTYQIALAFFTDSPTPRAAALLGEGRRLRQFCRRHS